MENVVVALFNFQKRSVMESLPEYVSSAVGKYATRCMAENEGVLVLPDEVWGVMCRTFHFNPAFDGGGNTTYHTEASHEIVWTHIIFFSVEFQGILCRSAKHLWKLI